MGNFKGGTPLSHTPPPFLEGVWVNERQVLITDSSHLNRLCYSPKTLELLIEFKDTSIYQYKGIPREIFGELVCSESPGGFFSQKIKDQYPFKKV